jgi:hypothetical protein
MKKEVLAEAETTASTTTDSIDIDRSDDNDDNETGMSFL